MREVVRLCRVRYRKPDGIFRLTKIMSVKIINYQRNGSGVAPGFYVATYTDPKPELKGCVNFVITFAMEGKTSLIASESVRVLCLDNLLTDWRGDHFESLVQTYVDNQLRDRRPTIYDLIEVKK